MPYSAEVITQLKIHGPFTGPTGYDHHVREFTRELSRQGVQVELIDFPSWGPARLPHALRDPWFETLTQPSAGRVVLHFALPDNAVLEPGRLNLNFTMFEATRIPTTWVEAASHHDLVILPTESSRDAWIASGVPESKLRLCPLGVSAGFLRERVPPMDIVFEDGRHLSDYSVRFFNTSELGPRKNLSGLIRAWMMATTARDDAVLLLKLGARHPGSLLQFRSEVALVENELGRRLDQAAPVRYIYDTYADADMPRLFAAATHYISTSFGEGWDLPMMEAAAMDLRLIAPGHSAYHSYLDQTIATLIPSVEAPALFPGGDSTGTLFEGANWWLPDRDAVVESIRRAVAGKDPPRESPRRRMRERFTWEKATARLIEILSEAEQTAT